MRPIWWAWCSHNPIHAHNSFRCSCFTNLMLRWVAGVWKMKKKQTSAENSTNTSTLSPSSSVYLSQTQDSDSRTSFALSSASETEQRCSQILLFCTTNLTGKCLPMMRTIVNFRNNRTMEWIVKIIFADNIRRRSRGFFWTRKSDMCQFRCPGRSRASKRIC